MWLGRCSGGYGLNDPERPLVGLGQVDNVHALWVAGVLV